MVKYQRFQDTIHVLLVGKEFDRLLSTLTDSSTTVDRVLLVHSEDTVSDEALSQVEADIKRFSQQIDIRRRKLATASDFPSLYREAYSLLMELVDELSPGTTGSVKINISAAPQLVSVAFIYATNVIVSEKPEYRGLLSICYAAPKTNHVEDLISISQEFVDLLDESEDVQTGMSDFTSKYVLDDLSTSANRLLELIDTALEMKGGSRDSGDRIDPTKQISGRELPTADSLKSLHQSGTQFCDSVSDVQTNLTSRQFYRIETAFDQLRDDIQSVMPARSDHKPEWSWQNSVKQYVNDIDAKLDLIEQGLIIEGDDLVSRMEQLDYEIDSQRATIRSLLSDIDQHGLSKGVKEINGNHYTGVPALIDVNLREVELELLDVLHEFGTVESIANLSVELARNRGEEPDESMRSTVQYNVQSLEEKGFVIRDTSGRSHRVQLSQMGKLWLVTHENIQSQEFEAKE